MHQDAYHAASTTPAQPTDPKRRYLCRHIHTDGHRCGSPALREKQFCYYHIRVTRSAPAASRVGTFTLQPIEDRAAIQICLFDVLSRIASGDIEYRRGSSLLYGLSIASSNLGKGIPAPAAAPIEHISTDYDLGDLAPIVEIPLEDEDLDPASVPIPNSASGPDPSPDPAAPAIPSEPVILSEAPRAESKDHGEPRLTQTPGTIHPTTPAPELWDVPPLPSVILSEASRAESKDPATSRDTPAPGTILPNQPPTPPILQEESAPIAAEPSLDSRPLKVWEERPKFPEPWLGPPLPTHDAAGRPYPPPHKLDPPDTGRIPWPRRGAPDPRYTTARRNAGPPIAS